MAGCPWCRTENPVPGAPCPGCGRAVVGQPQSEPLPLPEVGVPPKPAAGRAPLAATREAPELDFGPQLSKPAVRTMLGHGAPQQAPQSGYSAEPWDDFDAVPDPGQPAAVDVWKGAPRASNSRPPGMIMEQG